PPESPPKIGKLPRKPPKPPPKRGNFTPKFGNFAPKPPKPEAFPPGRFLGGRGRLGRQGQHRPGPPASPLNPPNPPQNPLNHPQNPGINPQNPGINPQNAIDPPQNLGINPQNPGTTPEKSQNHPENPPNHPQNLGISPQNPINSPQNPEIIPQKSQNCPENPPNHAQNLGISPQNLGISPQNVGISPQNLGISPQTPRPFLPAGSSVAVAASGGKDSTVLAHLLTHLNGRHRLGLRLALLGVDEGIDGYRDHALRVLRRVGAGLPLPLLLVSHRELFGWGVDELGGALGGRSRCTVCGVFRRHALERAAREMGADWIATGHNADDVAETVLMNFLRGDVARLRRAANEATMATNLTNVTNEATMATNLTMATTNVTNEATMATNEATMATNVTNEATMATN
ncbi:cytoplasmic tRNA 2-thiolation protein 1, partial [Zonotrichia leucophrys gambelii]|uniref:cytoplasmic tRNA 2-thiolation protein 1 n=1 Tax=Zonotrichia leucophrys gambelii TaxID=257770 RepID=UPI0031408F5D